MKDPTQGLCPTSPPDCRVSFQQSATNTGLDEAGRSIGKRYGARIKRPPFAHATEEEFECRLDFEVGDDGERDGRQFAYEYLEDMGVGFDKEFDTAFPVAGPIELQVGRDISFFSVSEETRRNSSSVQTR